MVTSVFVKRSERDVKVNEKLVSLSSLPNFRDGKRKMGAALASVGMIQAIFTEKPCSRT